MVIRLLRAHRPSNPLHIDVQYGGFSKQYWRIFEAVACGFSRQLLRILWVQLFLSHIKGCDVVIMDVFLISIYRSKPLHQDVQSGGLSKQYLRIFYVIIANFLGATFSKSFKGVRCRYYG